VLDGTPVAVKVLHPGLLSAVRQDLLLLDGLAAPLAAALPRVDPQAVLREVRERVLDELDLEHEAGVQRRFQRALRHHPLLTVPAPVMRLAHEQVLVSHWVDGTPLYRLEDQRECDRAAAALVVLVIGGLREGIMHADSDPADLLLTSDGRLAVLDFGSAVIVDPARANHALAAVEAFARRDGNGLGAALHELGVLSPERGQAVLELAEQALAELGGQAPSRLDGAAVMATARRLSASSAEADELMLGGNLAPEDLWPGRALAQMFSAIARIGATAPWRELIAGALRDGWDAEEREF
jgi:predicted unusual protein kinase regulating ubiquinone biosynthesis (AarF/ABC1/UbiB family)